jgi:hypothetical protein
MWVDAIGEEYGGEEMYEQGLDVADSEIESMWVLGRHGLS